MAPQGPSYFDNQPEKFPNPRASKQNSAKSSSKRSQSHRPTSVLDQTVQNKPGVTKHSRSQSRTAIARAEEAARYSRWGKNRLAIPYSTDGPKIIFGAIWFFLIIGLPLAVDFWERSDLIPFVVAAVLVVVAGLAGLQIGNTWFGAAQTQRLVTGFVAAGLTVAGMFGVIGLAFGVAVGVVLIAVASPGLSQAGKNFAETLDVMLRASLPVGIATGSLVGLVAHEFETGSGGPVLIALVVLISAYETGDFLVGSGANNSLEGPVAGLIALSVVGFGLFLLPPSAFPSLTIMVLFAVIVAVCCPLGQIFGSILLPSSTAWAPALRRLDSYLLSAPVWFGLVVALGF